MTTPTGDVNRLECSDVTVRFGGLVALKQAHLAVPRGATVGLVGPNGAGKSTLFGVLSGLLKPSSGTVRLDGEDVTGLRPQGRAARGLARTFQHPELFTGLTVREHLALAHRARKAKSRVWSDLVTMGSLRTTDESEKVNVEGLIELLGLQRLAEQRALGLPLGSARLVELGRALATAPSVLLLDEPSSGLDSAETDQFESTLARVARERDIAVLLVEHDVEMVMRMCSAVYVLEFGTMIAHGSPEAVRAESKVRAAYLGESVDAADPVLDAEAEIVEEAATQLSIDEPQRSVEPGTLVVRDLSVYYGDAVALSGIEFTVQPGRALAVLGPNGAGKSSLARALSGLVRPRTGSVLFDGHELAARPANRIRRDGLLHLPEGRGIFRSLSVVDNLKLAVSTVKGRQAKKEATEFALTAFPVLGQRRRQLAGSLSGGEQQMLSLARVLVANPKLVIVDEMSLVWRR